MQRSFSYLLVIILFLGPARIMAQYEVPQDTLPDNVLLEKQWSIGALLHTNGWGLQFSRGHNVTALRQFMWEVEFATYKSSKEVRSINPYFSDSKSYFYGKLNYLWFFRGGVGQQHILNRKPYWGGVQLSWLYYGGLSLAVTKPVYLYIIYFNSGYTDYEVVEERYDPELHFLDNIYGRGPFLSGFSQLGFHPGVYVKTGLEFEYGSKNRQISALEAGAILDFSPMPVAIMANNPKQSLFLTLYVSIRFGKRYNK